MQEILSLEVLFGPVLIIKENQLLTNGQILILILESSIFLEPTNTLLNGINMLGALNRELTFSLTGIKKFPPNLESKHGLNSNKPIHSRDKIPDKKPLQSKIAKQNAKTNPIITVMVSSTQTESVISETKTPELKLRPKLKPEMELICTSTPKNHTN